jgi:hypothetical protein
MGDMTKIIDTAVEDIEQLTVGCDRSFIEAALWKLWEAAYRDGYKDGQEDTADELAL